MSASAEFLSGAMENPELTWRELLLILRNRQAPPDLLRRVADDRGWMRRQEIRRAVALHPSTPLAVGRNLVVHLYWKELSEVALAPQVNPVIRRQAERRLLAQIEELGEGERTALARRASRAVIAALVGGCTRRELLALLGNPRMVEADAVRIASRASASPDALTILAGHERWGNRKQVRLALLANPRTPVPSALRMLRGLSTSDLRGLLLNQSVPKIVRVGAERMMKSTQARPGSTATTGQRHV